MDAFRTKTPIALSCSPLRKNFEDDNNLLLVSYHHHLPCFPYGLSANCAIHYGVDQSLEQPMARLVTKETSRHTYFRQATMEPIFLKVALGFVALVYTTTICAFFGPNGLPHERAPDVEATLERQSAATSSQDFAWDEVRHAGWLTPKQRCSCRVGSVARVLEVARLLRRLSVCQAICSLHICTFRLVLIGVGTSQPRRPIGKKSLNRADSKTRQRVVQFSGVSWSGSVQPWRPWRKRCRPCVATRQTLWRNHRLRV